MKKFILSLYVISLLIRIMAFASSPCEALTMDEYNEFIASNRYFARAVEEFDTEFEKGEKFMSPDEYEKMGNDAARWMLLGGIEESSKDFSPKDVAKNKGGIYSQLIDNYRLSFVAPSVRRAFLRNEAADVQGVYVLENDTSMMFLSIKTLSKNRHMVTLEGYLKNTAGIIPGFIEGCFEYFVFIGYGNVKEGKLTAVPENSEQSPDETLILIFGEDEATVNASEYFKSIREYEIEKGVISEGTFTKVQEGDQVYYGPNLDEWL